MKKVIYVCILVCLIFNFVACGQTTKQNNIQPTVNTEQNANAQKTSIELNFWDMAWGPPETYPMVVKDIVNKYEQENQNVKVNVQTIAWDNNYQIFLTAVASGTAPDVATTSSALPIQFHSMGALEPLNSILEEWKQEGKYEDITQADYDTFTFDGEVSALPWNLDVRGFYYRKDVFDQLGITEMPEDWDDFLAILREIKNKTDFIPFVTAGSGSWSKHVMYQFLIMNNIGLVTKDLEADLTSDSFINLLEFFNTLVREGLVPEGMAGHQNTDAKKLFLAGKAAVYLDNISYDILDYPEISDNTGILPVFKGPDGIKASPGWTNPILVFKQSDNIEQAKAFTKWYCENNINLFTESKFGKFPVKKSFLEHEYFTSNWLLKEVTEKVLPNTLPGIYPATSYYHAFSQINGENYAGMALQEVLVSEGNADVVKIAEDMNKKVKEALGK
jgi:multiple sugar transport system substrate-binding protein